MHPERGEKMLRQYKSPHKAEERRTSGLGAQRPEWRLRAESFKDS